jgi:peptidoglycan/LPS O-acetylase OafA/YrhL
MWPGNLSVTIFFILSGRVLANSFLKTGNPERLASSAFRRTFRLLIPIMVTLLLHWILQSCNVYEPLLIKAALVVNVQKPNHWWTFSGAKSNIKFYEIFTKAVALLLPPYRIPPFPIFSVFW